MKYTVKLNCHDWPHRGDTSKREVTVDARDDAEAHALGLIQASQNWPGAKLKVFDVVRDRIEAWRLSQAEAQAANNASMNDVLNNATVSRETPIREPVPHQITPRGKLGLRPA